MATLVPSAAQPLVNPQTGIITSAWLQCIANLGAGGVAGVATFNGRAGAVTLAGGDIATALGFTPYSAANPAGYIAGITGAMVTGALGFTPYNATNPSGFINAAGAPVQSVSGKIGAVSLAVGDVSGAAPLASPTFTGVPAAPTPATSDNSTNVATTAYVKGQGYITSAGAPVQSVAGKTGAVALAVADVSGAAPLASPSLTGTPSAPTAAVGTNTTQLATTAFVIANPGAVVVPAARVPFGTGSGIANDAAFTYTTGSTQDIQNIVGNTGLSAATKLAWGIPGSGTVFRAAIGATDPNASTIYEAIVLEPDTFIERTTTGAVSGGVQNDSPTSAAHAQHQIVTAAGGGDPKSQYITASTFRFAVGVDQSDSNAYVLSRGALLGTTNAWRVDATSGEFVANPSYANVKLYGAKGDGTTDDTAAIQAALNDTAYQSVYLPKGKYRITAALTSSNKPLHMFGDGQDMSLIIADGAINALTFVGRSANADIDQLVIRYLGFRANTTTALTAVDASWTWTSTFTGNTHSNTTIDSLSVNTATLYVGQTIAGSGIPANTTIASIVSSASITISAAATTTVVGDSLTTSSSFPSSPAAALIDHVDVSINNKASRFLTGFKLKNADNSRIRDCIFSQLNWSGSRDATGIVLTTTASEIHSGAHIDECFFPNCLTGISIDQSWEGVSVRNCEFVGVVTGIAWDGSAHAGGFTDWLEASGNHFAIYESGIKTTDVMHVNARGNYFLGLPKLSATTLRGVWITKTNTANSFFEDSIIANNKFHLNDNTYTAMYPVYVAGFNTTTRTARSIVIDDNIFSGLAWTKGALLDANTTAITYTDTNIGDNSEVCSDLGVGNIVSSNGQTTPVPTAGSGALTTASSTVNYVKNGRQVAFDVTIVITTNGTGATNIQVVLPFTASIACTLAGMRTETGTGVAVVGVCAAASSTLKVVTTANAYPAASGAIMTLSGVMYV